MKLSTQEELGLRCLLQIARVPRGEFISIAEIAELEGMSIPNVAKMLRLLRKAGFIEATRGAFGGYTLTTTPENIRLSAVISALGGKIYDDEYCGRYGELPCRHEVDCMIRDVWSEIQNAVDAVLNKITIQDLIQGHASSTTHNKITEKRNLIEIEIKNY
jgi:Rrf2 family protein